MSNRYPVIIVGAGASGLICAIETARRGKKVLLLDHASKIGQKIEISGGGNCNFTNLNLSSDNYISQNPSFCISALKRFSQFDAINFFYELGFKYLEKNHGRLFFMEPAKKIVGALHQQCTQLGVQIILNCEIKDVDKKEKFCLTTSQGNFNCDSLVIATGGLSYPKLGASNFGYHLAKKFDLKVTGLFPALVPLQFNHKDQKKFSPLSGVSLPVTVKLRKRIFSDDLLFTHQGLSGPAILQISSYWNLGDIIEIDLLPEKDLFQYLKKAKASEPNVILKNVLSRLLPRRFAELICAEWCENLAMIQYCDLELKKIATQIKSWQVAPADYQGYQIAEVTRGGVDTSELSSQTFETKKVPGLYFIGEVLDVTGQLGGYNLQWAWSSGYCVDS
jgi:predicted Rossmann fold flavoprotein